MDINCVLENIAKKRNIKKGINVEEYAEIIGEDLVKQGLINSIDDLTAGEKPSELFYYVVKYLSFMLSNDPEEVVSKYSSIPRTIVDKTIKLVGKSMLAHDHVIEDRNFLKSEDGMSYTKDKGIILPDEPVIWFANHGFKDDTLCSVLAKKRNAYILFGSLPQFYNTVDGITAWAQGALVVNRNMSDSRKASMEKAKKVIEMDKDIFLFPEGVFNRHPSKLLTDFWPGIYRLSVENGVKVVPIVHYAEDSTLSGDKSKKYHSVLDDPIALYDFSEKQAIEYIREVLATWYYLMMEKYGKSTREEVLNGYDNIEDAWKDYLLRVISAVTRYDLDAEDKAAYIPKGYIDPIKVWEPIANCSNPIDSAYASEMVKRLKRNNWQHKF